MSNDFYAYFGHHKCATQTMMSIVKLICFDLAFDFADFHNLSEINFDLNNFLKNNNVDFLAYTNANIEDVKKIHKNFKGFHVIRDPRDILVSAYFSHLKTHPTNNWPELIGHRKKLQEMSVHDGLLLEMDFSSNIFNDLLTWNYNQDNILEVKLENFMLRPYETFINIAEYLELLDDNDISLKQRFNYSLQVISRKASRRLFSNSEFLSKKSRQIPVDRLLYFVYLNQFYKKSNNRIPGEENQNSHYRKGISGDWKNYFSSTHIQTFRKKYNELLLRLGYETSETWGDNQ